LRSDRSAPDSGTSAGWLHGRAPGSCRTRSVRRSPSAGPSRRGSVSAKAADCTLFFGRRFVRFHPCDFYFLGLIRFPFLLDVHQLQVLGDRHILRVDILLKGFDHFRDQSLVPCGPPAAHRSFRPGHWSPENEKASRIPEGPPNSPTDCCLLLNGSFSTP